MYTRHFSALVTMNNYRLIIILLTSLSTFIEAHGHLVYNITCDRNTQVNCSDLSIQRIAHLILDYPQENVSIHLETSTLHLNTRLEFTNLSHLTITGESVSLTSITCANASNDDNGAGIVVSNIKSLELKSLKISFCGTLVLPSYKSTMNPPGFIIFEF